MQIIEDSTDANYVIDAHGPGWVSINHVTYTQSLIVMPNQLHDPWRPSSFEELVLDDLNPVLSLKPEVLIVGTGRRQRFPETTIIKHLVENQIGYEFMDNAAACRTYTVLMSEKRQVAAALLMTD